MQKIIYIYKIIINIHPIMPVLVVLHNVSQPKLLMDFAKTAFAFKTDIFIISNAIGFAESNGVKEVNKYAYLHGKSVIEVVNIKEAVDLFGPDSLYLIEKTKKSKPFEPSKVIEELKEEKTVMFVYSGTEQTNLQQEIGIGTQVYLEHVPQLSPVAICAILMYEIEKAWGKIT